MHRPKSSTAQPGSAFPSSAPPRSTMAESGAPRSQEHSSTQQPHQQQQEQGVTIVDTGLLRIEELRLPDQLSDQRKAARDYVKHADDARPGTQQRWVQPQTGDQVVFRVREARASGARDATPPPSTSHRSAPATPTGSGRQAMRMRDTRASGPQLAVLGSPQVPLGVSSALGYLHLGQVAKVKVPSHLVGTRGGVTHTGAVQGSGAAASKAQGPAAAAAPEARVSSSNQDQHPDAAAAASPSQLQEMLLQGSAPVQPGGAGSDGRQHHRHSKGHSRFRSHPHSHSPRSQSPETRSPGPSAAVGPGSSSSSIRKFSDPVIIRPAGWQGGQQQQRQGGSGIGAKAPDSAAPRSSRAGWRAVAATTDSAGGQRSPIAAAASPGLLSPHATAGPAGPGAAAGTDVGSIQSMVSTRVRERAQAFEQCISESRESSLSPSTAPAAAPAARLASPIVAVGSDSNSSSSPRRLFASMAAPGGRSGASSRPGAVASSPGASPHTPHPSPAQPSWMAQGQAMHDRNRHQRQQVPHPEAYPAAAAHAGARETASGDAAGATPAFYTPAAGSLASSAAGSVYFTPQSATPSTSQPGSSETSGSLPSVHNSSSHAQGSGGRRAAQRTTPFASVQDSGASVYAPGAAPSASAAAAQPGFKQPPIGAALLEAAAERLRRLAPTAPSPPAAATVAPGTGAAADQQRQHETGRQSTREDSLGWSLDDSQAAGTAAAPGRPDARAAAAARADSATSTASWSSSGSEAPCGNTGLGANGSRPGQLQQLQGRGQQPSAGAAGGVGVGSSKVSSPAASPAKGSGGSDVLQLLAPTGLQPQLQTNMGLSSSPLLPDEHGSAQSPSPSNAAAALRAQAQAASAASAAGSGGPTEPASFNTWVPAGAATTGVPGSVMAAAAAMPPEAALAARPGATQAGIPEGRAVVDALQPQPAQPAADAAAAAPQPTVVEYEVEVLAVVPGRGALSGQPLVSSAAEREHLTPADIQAVTVTATARHLQPPKPRKGVAGWMRRHLSLNVNAPWRAGKTGLGWLGLGACFKGSSRH